MSEVFGKIVLERKSQFLNRLKRYKVVINGTEQGLISNGKSEEYEVPAGENTITCKVNWCSSNTYTVKVNPGQKVFLKVSMGMKYFWPVYSLVMLSLFARIFVRSLPAELALNIDIISLVVFIPAIFYFLYYITIGRKSYLKLEEDRDNIFAN